MTTDYNLQEIKRNLFEEIFMFAVSRDNKDILCTMRFYHLTKPKVFVADWVEGAEDMNGSIVRHVKKNSIVAPERLSLLNDLKGMGIVSSVDKSSSDDFSITFHPNKFLEHYKRIYGPVNTNTKIVIWIDTIHTTIYRYSDNKKLDYVFKRKAGTNKRFNYILKISKNDRTAGKDLNKNLQAISTEIVEINEKIKRDLSLTEDMIINPANDGYQINKQIYSIEVQ